MPAPARIRKLRPTPAMAVALLALATGMSGGAYAAAQVSSPTISACVHNKGGGLYTAHTCTHGDRRLSWNATGPEGPPGAGGAEGPAGPPGPAGAAGPPGATALSDAFSGHKSGPVEIPASEDFTTIASLPIPTGGSYVIVAKADLQNLDGFGEGVICELVASVIELDGSRRNTEVDRTLAPMQAHGGTEVVLNVADQLFGAGTADLECFAPTDTEASNITVSATRVGTLANTTLP
jgi:hypothetical protein